MNYADELGIDLDALLREHPCHREQLQNARRIAREGAEYWARERLRQRFETRVRGYDFTDAQLEIARRSLDAGRSV